MQSISENNAEQEILAQAERLFLERGFAMTSTVEIARAAGCNQALVHYYFRTKERLFERVFEEKIKLFASTFVAIDNSSDSFEERLKHRIEAHFDILAANPKLPFLIINEITTNPKRIEALKTKLRGFMFGFAKTFQKELNEQIELEKIRPISAIDLLISAVALNASTFLMLPILEHGFQMSGKQIENLVVHRREEVVKMILNSIKA